MIEDIHAGDGRKALERVGQLASEGYELPHFCGEFTRYVRNLTIAQSCGADSPLLQVPNDERRNLAELAPLFSEEDLARFFQILLRTESEMRYSLQPRFHLELGLMKLVHARKLTSLEGLLAELRGAGGAEKPGAARPAATSAARSTPLKADHSEPSREAVQAPESAAPSPAVTARAAEQDAAAEDARLSAIKALLFDQSKKFLSSCLEHLSTWRFEDGEVRFLYAKKDSFYADLLKSREQQETLRAVCGQVLGQPVKICVRLEEAERQTRTARAGARERAERDAAVEAFRKRFDCTVVEVKDLSQE
jgi:DNA polymerase-3 subunit gamma/tau